MSYNNDLKTFCWKRTLEFKLYEILFVCFYFITCFAQSVSSDKRINQGANVASGPYSNIRLLKRSSGKSCFNTTDCASDIKGSMCLQNTCVCPQGYLPIKKDVIGCFQVGKHLGNFCNSSVQCGEELKCKNHVCLCPEDFQLIQMQGTNICLLWHKPTRLVDRCRINEDCARQDLNTVCKKRWCQCNNGYQMFETMLFGRKHKCFKTYLLQCSNSAQCSKLTESPEQHCTCLYGVCHCLTDMNLTAFDIPSWAEKPNWYQRWKKDLILATRLLFITVILFFVPCFIYITLGMRERSRQLFSQLIQPTRSPAIHYSQRRNSQQLRSLQSYRGLSNVRTQNRRSSGDSHQVEISLHANGVNSRLVNARLSSFLQPPQNLESFRDPRYRESAREPKEEDLPPSYEEIMHKETRPEEPPPPYRAL